MPWPSVPAADGHGNRSKIDLSLNSESVGCLFLQVFCQNQLLRLSRGEGRPDGGRPVLLGTAGDSTDYNTPHNRGGHTSTGKNRRESTIIMPCLNSSGICEDPSN